MSVGRVSAMPARCATPDPAREPRLRRRDVGVWIDTAAVASSDCLLSDAARSLGNGIEVARRCPLCGAAHGQPRLVAPGRRARGWHASLSRSGTACVVALSRARVGIDAERVDDVDVAALDAVLTPRERIRLVPGTPVTPRLAAILWCTKEAIGKAMGTGLGGPPIEAVDLAQACARHPGTWARRAGWSAVVVDIASADVVVVATDLRRPRLRIAAVRSRRG